MPDRLGCNMHIVAFFEMPTLLRPLHIRATRVVVLRPLGVAAVLK
jgi:hypothetical protein